MQYLTKDGKPITFTPKPFDENSDKRGWVVHKIFAYVNGEEAGYITLSYIAKDKWNQIYHNNPWIFRHIAQGHYDIPENILEDRNAIVKYYANAYYPDYPDKLSIAESWASYEEKKAKQEFRNYYLYFVDKPIVDFIRTYPKFKRQHIALSLHEFANQWLKTNFGLHLWMSYCRTDDGKCFYDANLLTLKTYRNNTMGKGWKKEREYMANSLNWYKIAQITPK
jgi:hypothetical protein